MEKPLIYLACPYADPDPAIRNSRYDCANRMAANMMKAGLNVFSPLSHSVPISQFLELEQHEELDFWMEQDLAILKKCDLLFVICIRGCDKSKGVAIELATAKELNIPCRFIEYFPFPNPSDAERINNRDPYFFEIAKPLSKPRYT
jgi:nucleoside 2-deoxyribosyltransferase